MWYTYSTPELSSTYCWLLLRHSLFFSFLLSFLTKGLQHVSLMWTSVFRRDREDTKNRSRYIRPPLYSLSVTHSSRLSLSAPQ